MQTEILISPAPTSSTFFSFCWRYLQNCRADLHQIFQKDGKLTAIEKLSFRFLNSFGGGRRFKRSLRLQTKLHKMQHGGKVDLLTEKRKPSDFGWTISQQNAENRAKICQRTAEMVWHILRSDARRPVHGRIQVSRAVAYPGPA